MTQARTRTYGLMIPSPLDLWIDAMLCAFVELVRLAVSTFRMRLRRPPVIGTQATPQSLPEGTNGIQQQETELAAQQGSPIALMLRDREAIVSKHEGVLTGASHKLAPHRDRLFLVPRPTLRVEPQAKAGTQSHNGNAGQAQRTHTPPLTPALAAMSGYLCAPKTNAAA